MSRISIFTIILFCMCSGSLKYSNKIHFFIRSEDISLIDISNHKISILPSEDWLNKNYFKLITFPKSFSKNGTKASWNGGNNKVEFSLSDSLIYYYEYNSGDNIIYNFDSNSKLSDIIDTKSFKDSTINYLQIGVPYGGNLGFEFYFEKEVLYKCKITNYPD